MSSSTHVESTNDRNLTITETSKSESNNFQGLYPNYDQNIWLRSCEKEVTEPLLGKVTGTVPTWLNGSLLRNGPGTFKFGHDEFKHLFDASALLHKFNIKNEKITYQCKFLQSENYKKNMQNNRIVVTEFGTIRTPDPCVSIFKRISSKFHPSETSDNANISLYPFGDELYAFSESKILHKVNTKDLSTDGRIQLTDYLAILHNTSHPHVVEDGTVFNLGLALRSMKPHHIIICHPAAKSGKEMFEGSHIVASIPARWPFHPSYMHSFGLTDNYFIIVEQPLTLSVPKLFMAKLLSRSPASSLKWFPNEHSRFNIISRKTGKLCHSIQAETFFYFHIIHQFEVDDHVVVDICTYDDASVLDTAYIESIKQMQSNPKFGKSFRARAERFVLPLKPEPMDDSNKNLVTLKNSKAEAYYLSNGDIIVRPERICDVGCEVPRINYNYLGKPYRYFYAMNSAVDIESTGSIVKVDTYLKTTKVWWEKNCYLSEPIFVPRPNSQLEDDGVVLASMIWGGDDINHVGLLILDGQTFQELGRAEFHTPTAVPKCFHGWFTPHKY